MILSAALLQVAELLQGVHRGTAGGGDAAHLVDPERPEPDDWFNGGTLWFLSGANAGKTAEISDYAAAAHEFTVPAQGGAVAAGDLYAALPRRWPRQALVAAVNQALSEIGPSEQVDDTLVPVLDQRQYALPAGVSDIRRVTVDDRVHLYWTVRGGELWFDAGHIPVVGADVKLYHVAAHASLQADGDAVSALIHPTRLAVTSAYYAVLAALKAQITADPNLAATLKDLETRRAECVLRYPVRLPNRDVHLPPW